MRKGSFKTSSVESNVKPAVKENIETQQDTAKFQINLHCVIFGVLDNELAILLVKDPKSVSRARWSLPFSHLADEPDLSFASSQLVKELTSRKCISNELIQIQNQNSCIFHHTMSVYYLTCIMADEKMGNVLRRKGAKWHPITRLNLLDFQQMEVVGDAIERLRYNATIRPMGFELLPENFTVPQVQKVYEAIFQTAFDRRNFSKKVFSTGLLIDTGRKVDIVTTNRARLYKLDLEKYKKEFCSIGNFIHSASRQFSFL